jgi:polysaccharide biosynthesis protein PslH
MKCLWIARYMPYPLDEGMKVYSAKMAESLAAAGVMVRFLGFGRADTAPADAPVEYMSVGGGQRSQLAAIFSHQPIAAAIDATAEYESLLEAQLRAEWDAIVLDSYASGWALEKCLQYVRQQASRRTVIVHVSHNHESAVWKSLIRAGSGSLARRVVLWQNYPKVRALERQIVNSVDVLSAICEEDLAALNCKLPREQTLALTPGYNGHVVHRRRIDERVPRRVAIVGSFRWVVKQENLVRFIDCADPIFHAHNIHLDVVGTVPDELLRTLQPRLRATTFHGFVDDFMPQLAQARMAIVPELIGGGFKLKFLDYLFARVPVATLTDAASGLPQPVRDAMLCSSSMPALVDSIVDNIDRVDTLDELQNRAFDTALKLFRWEDRGVRLKQTIEQLQQRWQQSRVSPTQADASANAKPCAARAT